MKHFTERNVYGRVNSKITIDSNFPEITEEEIKTFIIKMKNRKAPGADQITIEVIKAGGKKVIALLKKIFNKI